MNNDGKYIFFIKKQSEKNILSQLFLNTRPSPRVLEERQRRRELEESVRQAKIALSTFSYKPPSFFERLIKHIHA